MHRYLLILKNKLFPPRGDKEIRIADIDLVIDQGDVGGRVYIHGQHCIDEAQSSLYPEVARLLNPTRVVDVGANYGFTGAVFAKFFPKADLVLVEPDPKLGEYIRRNLALNGVEDFTLLSAICGDEERDSVPFGINPKSSQDNRVKPLDGWSTVDLQEVTLSQILDDQGDDPVFIKIDTQGFEKQVFAGGARFLESSDNWLIKTEFAPDWLESQGTKPSELLGSLVAVHDVIEDPELGADSDVSLPRLFQTPMTAEDVESFIADVRSRGKSGLGWTDLLLAPRNRNWK